MRCLGRDYIVDIVLCSDAIVCAGFVGLVACVVDAAVFDVVVVVVCAQC